MAEDNKLGLGNTYTVTNSQTTGICRYICLGVCAECTHAVGGMRESPYPTLRNSYN